MGGEPTRPVDSNEQLTFGWHPRFQRLIDVWGNAASCDDDGDQPARIACCRAYILTELRENTSPTFIQCWERIVQGVRLGGIEPSRPDWHRACEQAWRELQTAALRPVNLDEPLGIEMDDESARARIAEIEAMVTDDPNPDGALICELLLLGAVRARHDTDDTTITGRDVLNELLTASHDRHGAMWQATLEMTIRTLTLA